MPTLSIVILNWNVREMLLACLEALPDAAGEWWARAEVIVVDNASGDGSVEAVIEAFPGVRVIALKSNLGFSGGNNVGLRASVGDFVLFLNPDTVPRPGSIARLCDYMAANPDVGMVGPRLLNPDGTLQPSRRRFPTFMTGLVESTPLQRVIPNATILRRFYMLDTPDSETQDVGWLSGAALLCRREALQQVGPFDTGYFMFSEELDLCRRVYRTGWRIVYLPQAEIVHYGGGSTEQDVPARHINFSRGKVRYFRKHHGPIAGRLMRLYLLGTYAAQTLSEAAKWVLRHKLSLRRARLRMYGQVLAALASPGSRYKVQGSRLGDVLLITGEYPPARGGVGDYTCKLGLSLVEKGVESRVLTLPVAEGGDVARGMSSVEPNRQAILPLVVPRITLKGALTALRSTRLPIAHIQYQTGAYAMRPTINLLPLLLRLIWRGKVVVTFHDLRVPYLFPKAGPVREWANRLLARSAHVAVATNPEDATRLREWGARQVELIPIGSNIPNNPPTTYNRDEWRAARGIGPQTTLLAYFGFLNSSKGLDDLLRALHRLRVEGGDYKLVMVGGGLGSSDPTNRAVAASIDALAGDLGVRDHLIWTGYLSTREVSAALLSADMAVLPFADGASFRRGSLLAVLEHGMPLVTTDDGRRTMDDGRWTTDDGRRTMDDGRWTTDDGRRTMDDGTQHSALSTRLWPELLHGENALLAPASNPEALTACIRELAGSRELRERLARGARELAAFFAWEHIAEMHLKVYSRLCK